IEKIGAESLTDFFLYSALGGFALNTGLMFFADVFSNEKLIQLSFVSFIAILGLDLLVLSAESSFGAETFKTLLILLAMLIIAVPSVYIIQTWNLINNTFSPKSGANVYPFLATAPLVGNMTGGGAAHFIPKHFPTEALIWSWGGCIALAIAATFVLNRIVERLNDTSAVRVDKKELIENFKDGFRHYKKSAFARDLSVVFMSFWLVCTIVDFCYAGTLRKTYATSEQMASFYGAYTGAVNFTALFVQLFLGAKILKKVGVANGFMFLPASQIAGFVLLIFTPGLSPIVAMMFMQTLIGMSVQANSVSMSFNVFSADVRGKIRTLLEGVINPLGGVIGSLTIMAIAKFDSRETLQILPYAGTVFAGVWLFFTFRIRRSYLREIQITAQSENPQDRKDAAEAAEIERNAYFAPKC
ncbi:MAG TPA: hypothetical protein DD624_05915, partial [Alphaproteobacteria bacterium]|nr:hypothetical protein [Alphaproteobacteria bacterium]